MPTFAELKTSVSNRLLDPNNTAVSAANVGQAINDAITYWGKRHFWFNEALSTVTLTTDDPEVTMPSDFQYELPTGGFVINYSKVRYPITKVNNVTYDSDNTEGTGLPYLISYKQGSWLLYYYPDQDYNLEIRYVKSYSALSGDNDTNDFTDNADQLIMYEALSRLMAEYRQDPKMEAYYSERAKDEYNKLLAKSNLVVGTGELTVYQ